MERNNSKKAGWICANNLIFSLLTQIIDDRDLPTRLDQQKPSNHVVEDTRF